MCIRDRPIAVLAVLSAETEFVKSRLLQKPTARSAEFFMVTASEGLGKGRRSAEPRIGWVRA
jgi:hypothetical protein